MIRFSRLEDVVIPATGSRNPAAEPDAEFTYVDVAAVDNQTKAIAGAKVMLGAKAPSRARKIMRSGDVLVSTVRPNLNAVALVPEELDGQIASTGFSVLRAKRDRVLPAYLFYFVRSRHFIDGLVNLVSGALYPAVTDRQVLGRHIPLPSLEDQGRIVDLLSRAEGIVRLRREAQCKAQAIIPALFLDMFGDPAVNPKGWPVDRLGTLLAFPIRNGVSPSKSGRHSGRVLTLSAITRGVFDDSAVKEAAFATPLVSKDEVSNQDFLICRGNGNKSLVGVGCFPNRNMPGVAFPDTAMAIRPASDRVDPRFLAAQWQTLHIRQQIDAIAKTTNGTYKINQAGLFDIKLILPDLRTQRTFGQHMLTFDSTYRQQLDASRTTGAAFQAILARSFASE